MADACTSLHYCIVPRGPSGSRPDIAAFPSCVRNIGSLGVLHGVGSDSRRSSASDLTSCSLSAVVTFGQLVVAQPLSVHRSSLWPVVNGRWPWPLCMLLALCSLPLISSLLLVHLISIGSLSAFRLGVGRAVKTGLLFNLARVGRPWGSVRPNLGWFRPLRGWAGSTRPWL